MARPILAQRNTGQAAESEPRGGSLSEPSHGFTHQFRRLRVRHEKRADIHEAFLTIGCTMSCYNLIQGFC